LPLRLVRITAFRCIAAAEVALDPARNHFFGPNGAGKTSLLEAIFLLGRGRSFRTRHTRTLVTHGENSLTVYGEVEEGPRIRRLGATFSRGHLDKRLDGERATGSALAGVLPTQSMGPDSHELIEGGPSGRRRLLDWGVFHVEQAYLETWQRYRRLLGQRNTALQGTGASGPELHVWTTALIEAGEEMDRLRTGYVAHLAKEVAEQGRALLGADVTLEYRRGWPAREPLERALAASEPRDRLSGHTEVGPHRADIAVFVDGRKVETVASRGQQKLVVAALIRGQEQVLRAAHGGKGLLLVDDPAAELDRNALERLVDRLARVESQLIFTGLDPIELPSELSCARFHVERGQVRAL
jgi:DNA replication and repair protein RecF